MALDIAKLKLIRDTAEQMSGMSHADLNLVLYEAGLGHLPNHWYGDDYNGPPSQEDRRQIAVDILRDVSVTEIGEISVALQQLYDLPHVDLKPSEPSIVRLFASHLDAQMKLVREVADVLSTYCISLFVAHNDIPVDDEWHNAIESHLQSVDGGVVFLHPGFNKSEWCDQEVGWLLGRGTPVFTLKFADQHPYGPLGKRQALVVQPTATASTVAGHVVDWINGKQALRRQLNASLAAALQQSHSFAHTDRIWARLRTAGDLTVTQVAAIATAVRDNSQVYGAQCRVTEDYGEWYPQLILTSLLTQPGYEENRELIAEVARLRKVDGLL